MVLEKKVKGKLIVVDGGDGSGKNTQTNLLVRKLEEKGVAVKKLDFPQYDTFFGKLISSYLNGEFGSLEDLNPKIPSLFFALDRFSQKERIKKWLDEGYNVVLDRYVESNLAYQSAKLKESEREKFIRWINQLEYDELNVPKADIIIYLHVPVEVSEELIKTRPDKDYIKDKRKDIHENDISYLKQVEKNYLNLAKQKSWVVVECVENGNLLSIGEIFNKIFNIISKVV